MIDKHLLSLLVCPENHTPLVEADAQLIEKLNRGVMERRLKNRAGKVVEKPLDGGLVREDRALLYPVVDGIPVMLIDEAIPLAESGEA
ncbi:MAG: Trm112 family protein [Planctomycetota bacterium]